MKTIIMYLWHAACAAVLNFRATRYARQMRDGVPKSGEKLKDIGARSNVHERARDDVGEKIRNNPAEHSFYAAVLVAGLLLIIYAGSQ